MAMADYYLCDGCGGKAFYDADIREEFENLTMVVLCPACIAKGWTAATWPPPITRGDGHHSTDEKRGDDA